MSFVPLVRLWIWVSVFASAAGWTLSAFGQLNRTGYGICFIAFVIFLIAGRKEPGLVCDGRSFRLKKFLRRFRRPLPLCFAALAVLIFLGGAIYPPSNYTGITYHIPRVLQWLAHGGWWWIHTPVSRMNYSGCALEWMGAPLILFTKSDRALFLLNFIPFLFLPGLIFSVFTRLGVGARVAWQWMWLLPTGYNFMLQAGSIGNDAFSAVLALAAVDFGCRAWESRRVRDLWCSLLAVALLTGTKATSLPLLLPWLVLIFPLMPLLRRRRLSTLVVAALAAGVSFLPVALMNEIHTGNWLGTSIEPSSHLAMKNPFVGLWGNAFQLALDNFVPPVFPPAGWWNQQAPLLMPHSVVAAADNYFDSGFFTIGELPTEDWAGIGFGVCVLAVVSWLASFCIRRTVFGTSAPRIIPSELCRCVLLAAWISLAVYCMKSGMTTAARLIAPYYLLLAPLLLIGAGQSQIIRHRWWRAMAGGVLILAFVVLILSPDRPLWPAKTILSRLSAQHPGQKQIARALKVYTIYSERSDPLAGVRKLLPPEAQTVGFIGTPDDTDISLWRPFNGRRVEHFLLTDPPEQIQQQVQYVVVGGENLKEQGVNLDAWLQKSGAELVATTNATVKISEGMQPWYVVRFKQHE
jgi:hypothetical protein